MLLKKTNFHLYKRLIRGKISLSGTNNTGRKVLYHRGAGMKRSLRVIDFSKYVCSVPALILSVEYDPTRTALVSLVSYANGAVSYNLSVNNAWPGTVISMISKKIFLPNLADSSFLNVIKPGTYLSSVEAHSSRGATYVRVGGAFAKLVSLAKNENFVIIKLKSKTLLRVNANNIATLGTLVPPFRLFKKNAGTSRRLGRRPHVRGVAMNPVDHPHGGGQGKTSGGRPSVTPWALTTKGRKTKRKVSYAQTAVKG